MKQLCVLLIHGLDRRTVDASTMPQLSRMLSRYPGCALRPLPATDSTPTLLTGVLPHEHGSWQLRLRDELRRSAVERWIDRLPDLLTTTAQCVRFILNKGFDLPTLPPRRRRRFELRRFKYARGAGGAAGAIPGAPTLLDLLGAVGRLRLSWSFDQLRREIERMPAAGIELDLCETQAIDHFMHWSLDRREQLLERLAELDGWVTQLQRRCAESGATLMLLVTHGHERVRGCVDLKRALRESGGAERDYSYFCESTSARFWFHTEGARRRIGGILRELEHTIPLGYRQMHEHDVRFEDERYGELYLYAEPGWIFFPDDFYHPLVNTIQGIRDPTVRGRLRNPRMRGAHGYLGPHPAEEGFALLAAEGAACLAEPMRLVDFAPTVLRFLGREIPESMTGRPCFRSSQEVSFPHRPEGAP